MPSRTSNAVLVGLLGLASASTNGCGGRKGLGGGAGSGDSAGTSGAAGASAAAGTFGLAGSTGAAGAVVLGPLDGDVSKIVATPGCGRPARQQLGTYVRGTIQTMGEKPAGCADSKCGPWSYTREYFLRLPADYDATKAYPITFEGPGCGGTGRDLFYVTGIANSTIRVGLTPPPNSIGHATNPNQGCFDDKEGDDSVDWVFYENLYDQLAAELCFDRNRVFAAGNSVGARMANELGCKYAGDALRPVRGVMSNAAGLPDPTFQPTCTSKPMAGIWSHETANQTILFTETTRALARAMSVSGCTVGTSYETAELDLFPIGAGNPTAICKRIKGCPASVPLVICPLPGHGQGSNDNVVVPAWATFINLFAPTP